MRRRAETAEGEFPRYLAPRRYLETDTWAKRRLEGKVLARWEAEPDSAWEFRPFENRGIFAVEREDESRRQLGGESGVEFRWKGAIARGTCLIRRFVEREGEGKKRMVLGRKEIGWERKGKEIWH